MKDKNQYVLKKEVFSSHTATTKLIKKNSIILDLGCLKGGAGFLMARINKKGTVYCYDTFSGFLNYDKFYKKILIVKLY